MTRPSKMETVRRRATALVKAKAWVADWAGFDYAVEAVVRDASSTEGLGVAHVAARLRPEDVLRSSRGSPTRRLEVLLISSREEPRQAARRVRYVRFWSPSRLGHFTRGFVGAGRALRRACLFRGSGGSWWQPRNVSVRSWMNSWIWAMHIVQ